MPNLAGRTVVGLDIEPGYIAAVQTQPGSVAVERAVMAPLAPGVVRDGEVIDVDTLAAALRELFSEHKLNRRVRLGVANQRIVVRMLDLPPLQEDKEIASAVRFQAQDHIPMPLEQSVLEHHALGLIETEDGPRTRVVVVAARRDMIDKLLEAARRAGLRVDGVDVSAFAMIRALHQPGSEDAVAYINLGGVTNLAIAMGSTCVFTRVLGHGLEAMAVELAERRGLTLEHAHGWLRYVGLMLPLDDLEGDREIVVEARNVLSDGVKRVADEVRNTLDFHTMQQGATPVQRGVLTGPALAVPGFHEQLGHEVGLPLQAAAVAEARPGGFGSVDAGRLAVAAGLTVQEAPA